MPGPIPRDARDDDCPPRAAFSVSNEGDLGVLAARGPADADVARGTREGARGLELAGIDPAAVGVGSWMRSWPTRSSVPPR